MKQVGTERRIRRAILSNRSLRLRPEEGPASLMEAMVSERLAPGYGYGDLSDSSGARGQGG